MFAHLLACSPSFCAERNRTSRRVSVWRKYVPPCVRVEEVNRQPFFFFVWLNIVIIYDKTSERAMNSDFRVQSSDYLWLRNELATAQRKPRVPSGHDRRKHMFVEGIRVRLQRELSVTCVLRVLAIDITLL
jgi:hypothetical protein